MQPAPYAPPLSGPEIRRAWRIVTLAGVLGITYFAFCLDVPRVRFLTELGATPFDFGIMSGLGSLAIVFQLFSRGIAIRFNYSKRSWIVMMLVHRLVFLGVLASPLLFLDPRVRIWWIIGVLFVHDSLAQLGGPMWLDWMTELLPENTMNQRWASRQAVVTGANMVAALVAAFAIGHFEEANQVVLGFGLLAGVGVAAGASDILLFTRVPRPPAGKVERIPLLRSMQVPLRDPEYRPFLHFMIYWQFALMVGGPFFVVYMISSLKMPAFYVQIICMSSLVGMVVASRFWGLVCDAYGNRPVLQFCVMLKTVTVLAMIFIPPIPAIFVPGQILAYGLDGVLNAGIVLAVQGIMLHTSPRAHRTMYIATANFFSVGIAGGVAPLLAGRVIQAMEGMGWPCGPYRFTAYHLVFVVSVLLRLGGVALAGRVPSRKRVPMGVVVRQMVGTNLPAVLWGLNRLARGGAARVRIHAARRLGARRSPLAIGGLIDALHDADQGVRHAAANALGRIGTADAALPLGQVLCDPAWGKRTKAAQALGRIGGYESLKVLLENLRNLDAATLGRTLDVLGRIGDSTAILPLICLISEVEDPALREKTARTLSTLSRANTPQEVMQIFATERRNSPRI